MLNKIYLQSGVLEDFKTLLQLWRLGDRAWW